MEVKYKHLLFDADGTLYDFEASENFAIEETWKEYGIELNDTTVQCFMKHNHAAWKQYEVGEISFETLKVQRFQHFFDELNLKLDGSEVEAKYLMRLAAVSVMFQKSLPLLTELKKRGYKIYIVTNGIHEVAMGRLKKPATDWIYEGIFTPKILGASKPRKECFESLFNMVGITESDKKQTVMIGDSLSSDIQGGINAGVDTIWYNPTKKPHNLDVKPTFEISDLDQLYDFFPPLQ